MKRIPSTTAFEMWGRNSSSAIQICQGFGTMGYAHGKGIPRALYHATGLLWFLIHCARVRLGIEAPAMPADHPRYRA